jgi:S-formylglutathione hydrolase FrmB
VTLLEQLRHHLSLLPGLSLMHGWIPITAQVLAGILLIAAVGWRNRRWRLVWLPVAALVGVAAAVTAYAYLTWQGMSDQTNPAPYLLWIWIGLFGVAAAVLIAGWRGARWWRRGVSALALPLCVLCSALAVNMWVGYLPTVQTAWNQATAAPLPDQTDTVTVTVMQKQHAMPAAGTVVPVTIPDTASGFKHRGELVYLPPRWYATDPAPPLPTVMMVGGEFNTPDDWLRAGQAVTTIDKFAAGNDGNAPVFVFVDSGGTFNNDTECVNGTRGSAADHLTKDVVPFMLSHYGVSPNRANWGVAGFSTGGTCAVDLAVMHPDMFGAFDDIAGDLRPNSGNKAQTIARLFGGNAAAYAAFDPITVITRHGPYTGLTGEFDINGPGGPAQPRNNVVNAAANPNDETAAASSLCTAGSANGITCAVLTLPGRHDWPFAAQAFAAALPWLAGQLRTPGVPAIPLPAPPPVPAPPPAPPQSAPLLQAAAK